MPVSTKSKRASVPVPSFFDASKVGQVWRVPYEERAQQAREYSAKHKIPTASQDKIRVGLLLIDVQNTFCTEGFELFVQGAVEDNQRLTGFIYENLAHLTEIIPTLDTHKAAQIFHGIFWENAKGEPPPPMTQITLDDVEAGRWRVNTKLALNLEGMTLESLQNFALHYVRKLTKEGKYPLMIWPYHSILGGIGHAMVSAVEEACFFHQMVRQIPTRFELKGENPLTENYSILQPEVLKDARGRKIAEKNKTLIQHLLSLDTIIITGQAKSHCVAWTIDHLLSEILEQDQKIAKKVYLLEDATSPVIVPGIVDFTEHANRAYQKFEEAGMHRVKTTTPLEKWPSIRLNT